MSRKSRLVTVHMKRNRHHTGLAFLALHLQLLMVQQSSHWPLQSPQTWIPTPVCITNTSSRDRGCPRASENGETHVWLVDYSGYLFLSLSIAKPRFTTKPRPNKRREADERMRRRSFQSDLVVPTLAPSQAQSWQLAMANQGTHSGMLSGTH